MDLNGAVNVVNSGSAAAANAIAAVLNWLENLLTAS
jgi:hypothetical protein